MELRDFRVGESVSMNVSTLKKFENHARLVELVNFDNIL